MPRSSAAGASSATSRTPGEQVRSDVERQVVRETRSEESVASPGFVARRGKAGNEVMEHSWWTSGPGAAAAR